MRLNPGTRLGAYEILSAIGAGGMGEVYRVRDTRSWSVQMCGWFSDVQVVTFPDVTDKRTISTSGGTAPRWRQDGSELFFVDAAGILMSAPVTRGERFGVGVAKPLFELQAVAVDGWNYAVSADGQRILAARSTDAATTPITVVVNWTALLKR